jgi:hypothetical protein
MAILDAFTRECLTLEIHWGKMPFDARMARILGRYCVSQWTTRNTFPISFAFQK